MQFCETYRFFPPKQEQKRDNLLVLSADYPDYCGLDLISTLYEKAVFMHLFDHSPTIHRLNRTVVIVMHGVVLTIEGHAVVGFRVNHWLDNARVTGWPRERVISAYDR
jgi:hypothetical protein